MKIPKLNISLPTGLKKLGKNCFLGLTLSAANYAPAPVTNYTQIIAKEAKTAAQTVKIIPKTITWQEAATYTANMNQKFLQIGKQDLFNKQVSLVTKIIEEDKFCLDKSNKEEIAKQIVKVAKEYGADPITIACVVKKESHFTMPKKKTNGVGYGQLTRIAIKDMYQRPKRYDPKFEAIKKQYPDPNALYQAIGQSPTLNLEVCAIHIQSHLKSTKGNLKMALKNYNGSKIKESYAKNILADINKYKKVKGNTLA